MLWKTVLENYISYFYLLMSLVLLSAYNTLFCILFLLSIDLLVLFFFLFKVQF